MHPPLGYGLICQCSELCLLRTVAGLVRPKYCAKHSEKTRSFMIPILSGSEKRSVFPKERHSSKHGFRARRLNPFHWIEVILNCLGSPDYDPTIPRLYKWNSASNAIACDCKTFVDDLRSICPTRSLCRAATHQEETMMGISGTARCHSEKEA